MNAKNKNWADLILNVAVILCTVAAIGVYFVSGPDALGSQGTACFRYFTTDSNVLVALTSIVMLVYNIRRVRDPQTEVPRWALIFRYVGVTSVTITLLTVVFFLAPVAAIRGGFDRYFFFFKGNTFALHFSTPMIAILGFCLLEKDRKLTVRDSLWALLPTVVYSIVYLVLVVFAKVWTDWYGFTFGGQTVMIPVSMIAMYLVTWGVANVLRVIGPKTNKA